MSDTSASAEAGWNRYYVKSSGLLERDLSVYRDESLEDRMFSIVGDKKGAEISDAGENVVMTVVVTKGFLSKVEYTNADGTSAGHLTTNSVFSKKAMELTRSRWSRVDGCQDRSPETVLLGTRERCAHRKDGSADVGIEAHVSTRHRRERGSPTGNGSGVGDQLRAPSTALGCRRGGGLAGCWPSGTSGSDFSDHSPPSVIPNRLW